MNPRMVDEWGKVRKKGAFRYVVFRAAPIFMIFFYVPITFISWLLFGEEFRFSLVQIAVWISGGLIYGSIIWNINESKYSSEIDIK